MSQTEAELALVIITDFDGTATGVSGGEVVFSPFYKSLQQDPSSDKYQTTPLVSEEVMQSTFSKEFKGKRDDPRLISQQAEDYFHHVLADPRAELCINTRNRRDYIIAMLKYLKFTQQQIDAIHFNDAYVKDVGTTLFLDSIVSRLNSKTQVRILDDNIDDYELMLSAAQQYPALNNEHISGFNKAAGDFNATWGTLLYQEFNPSNVPSESELDNYSLSESNKNKSKQFTLSLQGSASFNYATFFSEMNDDDKTLKKNTDSTKSCCFLL